MKAPYFFFVAFLLGQTSLFAQDRYDVVSTSSRQERFIDKVEVFVGSSFSFNYGNKFLENYEDENVQNKRLMKVGYSLGVGGYHPIKNRLDINVRFSWDRKGTKAELDHPLNPVNDDTRQTITSEYDYYYKSISITPRVTFGSRKKFALLIGGYLSKINKSNGTIIYYDERSGLTTNNFTGRYWNGFAPDGGINSSTFIPGLNSFESYDYGIVFGLSYQLIINESHSLLLQVIDNFGLMNVYDNSIVENLPEKNHSISLLIGYNFTRPFMKTKNY